MGEVYHTESSNPVESFIQHGVYLRGWSARTVRTYRQGLSLLSTHLGTTPLTTPLLRSLVAKLRQHGLTSGGINMHARTINSYLAWLHAEGRVLERLRIALLPNPPKPLTTFSDADIRRLVTFRPRGYSDARTWALIVVLLDTGVRIDEALGLEQERVDLDNLTIRVRGKGSRERIVPISAACRKPLFTRLAKPAGRYVFATKSGARLSYRNAYRDITSLCARLPASG